MITVQVTNICWDTDGDIFTDLPLSVSYEFDEDMSEDEVDEVVGDKLSDDYGYCHNGFYFDITRHE